MAGRHRRVSGKNAALPDRFAIGFRHRSQIAARRFALQKRQSQKRGVALVHMVCADVLVAKRLKHRHAAHA